MEPWQKAIAELGARVTALEAQEDDEEALRERLAMSLAREEAAAARLGEVVRERDVLRSAEQDSRSDVYRVTCTLTERWNAAYRRALDAEVIANQAMAVGLAEVERLRENNEELAALLERGMSLVDDSRVETCDVLRTRLAEALNERDSARYARDAYRAELQALRSRQAAVPDARAIRKMAVDWYYVRGFDARCADWIETGLDTDGSVHEDVKESTSRLTQLVRDIWPPASPAVSPALHRCICGGSVRYVQATSDDTRDGKPLPPCVNVAKCDRCGDTYTSLLEGRVQDAAVASDVASPAERLRPEERAVIDAAKEWREVRSGVADELDLGCDMVLADTIDALLAASGGGGEIHGEQPTPSVSRGRERGIGNDAVVEPGLPPVVTPGETGTLRGQEDPAGRPGASSAASKCDTEHGPCACGAWHQPEKPWPLKPACARCGDTGVVPGAIDRFAPCPACTPPAAEGKAKTPELAHVVEVRADRFAVHIGPVFVVGGFTRREAAHRRVVALNEYLFGVVAAEVALAKAEAYERAAKECEKMVPYAALQSGYDLSGYDIGCRDGANSCARAVRGLASEVKP